MNINIQKLSDDEIESLGILSWPIWEKEVSTFDWSYDSCEKCYILEGDVTVTTENGQEVSFGPGDFVTFPKGLKCTWDIKKAVRKHYTFE